MVGQTGDTYIMDSPESWIGENKSQEDIIGYRMNLVRGKQLIDIKDLENPFVEKLQDISLASKSIDSEATFGSRPSFAIQIHRQRSHFRLKALICIKARQFQRGEHASRAKRSDREV